MSESYYSTKSLPELLRLAESSLKQLKATNKQIEDLLDNLEANQSDSKLSEL